MRMNNSRLVAIASASVVVLAASASFAQQPPPGAPPPGSPPPGAPPPGYPPPGYGPPPGYVAAPPPADPDATRFRWGISGVGGKYFVSGQSGGIYGVDLRFGAQFGRMYGVYGAPILLVGAGVEAGNSGAKTSALVLYGVGAIFDITLEDMFFAGVGPELIAAAGASTSVSNNTATGTSSSSAAVEAGTFFGVQAHAGLALGSVQPARRKCFTIAIDLHTVFMHSTTVIPMLALGYDAF